MSTADGDGFESFIARAWEQHADDAPGVAQRLAERCAHPLPGDLLARAAALIAHVYGEHLGRYDEGIALLQRVARNSGDDPALARAAAALGLAAGHADASDHLAADDRVAARATAAAALAARHELPKAMALLRDAVAEAATAQLASASIGIRALAVAGNNLACELEERAQRTEAETAAMIEAAQLGLDNWRRCGGWLEHERAEYRLGRSLWRADRGAEGLAHALSCLAICEAEGATAFERFFAHALAALCARAAGDTTAFDEHHEAALGLLPQIEAEDAGACADDLAMLRQAAGPRHPGRCTCGQVRFRLNDDPLFVHGCHCRWCQRETGSAFAVNAMIESDRVERLGTEPELVETPSASGAGQLIARCPRCRVAVWSHYSGAGRAIAFVRVGTLLDPDRLPPDIHIFTSTRQPWLTLPEGVPAVPEYYRRSDHWPPESLRRREMLLAGGAPAD